MTAGEVSSPTPRSSPRRLEIPAGWMRLLRPVIEHARGSRKPSRAPQNRTPFYVVGGCVRDWLLKVPTKDLDLVTEDDAARLARFCLKRWGGRLEEFDRFGTLRLHAAGGLRVDFVRARAETYPAPAALPVVRPGTLAEDLRRRDFTVNAMAAAPEPDGRAALLDPFGGIADLGRRVLRVLHGESFRDDPTRIFRAARFACRFGFRIEPRTDGLRRRALAEGVVGRLSRERLRAELLRVLEENEPECALRKLRDWGLAGYLHPRFSWPSGIAAIEGPYERLGSIMLTMGPAGGKLVRSLNLERPVSQALLEALEILGRRASPRNEISGLARRALLAYFGSRGRRELRRPHSSRAALRPLLVDGGDLRGLGLDSGPVFKEWLGRAAKAQWKGEFSTRSQAVRWLRSRLRGGRISPSQGKADRSGGLV